MKTASKKRTFTKASPKKTELISQQDKKTPVEKPQKEALLKTEPVESAAPAAQPVARPIIAQVKKQNIVVEERDAVSAQLENDKPVQAAPVASEPTVAESAPTQEVKEVPQDKIEKAPIAVETAREKEPEEKTEAASTSKSDIPSIDQNASLKIDEITKFSEVPTIDKNAPLKIDESEVKEETPESEKLGRRLFVLGGVVLALIVLAVFGFIFIFMNNPPGEKKVAVVVTKEPAKTSPSPILVRSEWPLEVLNGSGIAGVAKKAAATLEILGYQVVVTGNADASSYTENKLYVAADMASKEEFLVADLKADFNISSVSGVLTGSTASARLIIGK